ncbi:hypothetical protein ACIRD9_13870 [Streptomyces violaceus]
MAEKRRRDGSRHWADPLECNQSGQFAFVELETGQPISEAVAQWLS